MSLRSWLRRPIKIPSLSAQTVLVIVVLQLLLSVGLAIILSNDPDWGRWHISYLGEGASASAHFFNISMWIGGGLVVWFGWKFYQALNHLRGNERFKDIKPKVAAGAVAVIGLCVYLVGLFPRSFGVLPHDIFGHAIYFVFLVLCIGSPWILPGMNRWFYAVSYLFHAAMVVLFVMYWTGVSESLYVAEVATFVFFIGWAGLLLSQLKQEPHRG